MEPMMNPENTVIKSFLKNYTMKTIFFLLLITILVFLYSFWIISPNQTWVLDNHDTYYVITIVGIAIWYTYLFLTMLITYFAFKFLVKKQLCLKN